MVKNRRAVGREGENVARRYLEERGYQCLAANFSTRWGEIDLIMKIKDTLVFVEVKQKETSDFGEPAEAVTRKKINRLTRAAMVYLQAIGVWNAPMRFDVVSMGPSGLRHYRNAFNVGNDFYY